MDQQRLSSKSKAIKKSKTEDVPSKRKKVKKSGKKAAAKKFFEDEAEEGDTDSDDDVKNSAVAKKQEKYRQQDLEQRANRLDNNMVDDMLDRYQKDYEEALQKGEASDEEKLDGKMSSQQIEDDMRLDDDVARDINLPSIKDSKLWSIKVTPGRERELVFKITNKLIEFLNSGNPLNVLDVFQSQVCPGLIYCEAYKSQHVEKVIFGLAGIRPRTVTMIPINEMTEVMKTCEIVEQQKLQVHQWVRIKGGIHRDDLGLIELVDGNRKALVRLIPRIPEDFYTDREKTLSSLRALSRSQSEYIRIPQRLFNPLRVKDECQCELYRPLEKSFYFWRRMMFRNGFLYQEFAANKLITENVCPSLQEVRMF